MSPSDILTLAISIGIVAASIVIAYKALRLRTALVDPPYRARAFWTAVGGLSAASTVFALYADSIYGSFASSFQGLLIEDVAWGFVFFGMYGWIASNIGVAISADYFNRDALSWKKGGGIVTTAALFTAYAVFSVPFSWWYPQASSTGLVILFLTFLIAVVVGYSAATLAVASRRIDDKVIKRYTRWVALSVLLVVFFAILSPSAIAMAPMVLWVYSTYRAVGSLAIRTRKLPGLAP